MEAIENFAKNEGFPMIYLGAIREKELPAYYKKIGYVEDSVLQRPTYELVIMKKELN